MERKVLFILAHPYISRSIANKAIVDHLKSVDQVTIHDLYESYPYFNIDVRKEQDLLRSHDLIVFQHPFYWYNMPPLLKLWEDEVLEPGFAFGDKGTVLNGKQFLLSITTGGSRDAYQPDGANRFLVESFFHSYVQLCHLCGLKWNTPLVLHSSRKTTRDEIVKHADKVKSQIENFIDKGVL